jgi:hypothetical protein
VGRSIFGEETFAVIFVLRRKKGASLIPTLSPLFSDTFALLGLFPSAPVKRSIYKEDLEPRCCGSHHSHHIITSIEAPSPVPQFREVFSPLLHLHMLVTHL